MSNDCDLQHILIEKLQKASHRQKIATLVASDYIQLMSFPPSQETVSIAEVITEAISFIKDPRYVNFQNELSYGNLVLGPKQNDLKIIANRYFLYNFYTTILQWLKGHKTSIEIEVINPIAIEIKISIPFDGFLSNIQGFALIAQYIPFVTGFFNGRAWLTQNTINIIYPLIVDEPYLNHLMFS
ncbi:MAG: hypothetical protein ACTSR2_02945 [Candidatus Hodarchaeales archaeon]